MISVLFMVAQFAESAFLNMTCENLFGEQWLTCLLIIATPQATNSAPLVCLNKIAKNLLRARINKLAHQLLCNLSNKNKYLQEPLES